jgi:hypothetical protein
VGIRHLSRERLLRALWYYSLEPVTRFRFADRQYSRVRHLLMHGRIPNTQRPKTFTEHLLSMKFSGELLDPLRCRITDKEHLKDYVASTIGGHHIIPSFAVLRSPGEVERFRFPDRCAIKPTHSSGQRIFRRHAGDPVDRKRIKHWFALRYYPQQREENYRRLQPKVIVEELLEFGGSPPLDYKIHCFHGIPKFVHVLAGLANREVASGVYAPDWRKLDVEINKPGGLDIERPKNLDAILELCARLAAPFSYIRVDLYTDEKRIYIGELTNMPAAGHLHFRPLEADENGGLLFRDAEAEAVDVFRTDSAAAKYRWRPD